MILYNAYARNTDPVTSLAAADAIEPRIPNLERLVLEYLERCKQDGATSKETAHGLGLEHVTISPRFRPLARRGMIRDSGRKRDRSIVWVVV